MLAIFDVIRPLVLRVIAVLQCTIPLVTRLLIGQAFLQSGYGKFFNQGVGGVAHYFTTLHIPAPYLNALFISSLEFAGGIAIILGLGTRVFAALLSCTMVVAIITATSADFLSAFSWWPDKKGLLDVTETCYMLVLLWLVAFGPGPISLDRLIAHRCSHRRSQEALEKALEHSRR